MKERNKTVDILRGIATFGVLIGHAIQRGLVTNYINNLIFRLIYSFHMPLFIILSGYTLYLSNPVYDKRFILKKAKRLLLPTILWSYILYFMKDLWFVGIQPFIIFPDNILSYTKTLFLHPDFIFWFLYILFIFMIIFYVGKKLPEKYFLPFLITVEIIFWMFPTEYFGMYSLRLYFPLFILGYLTAKYKDIIINKLKYYLIPAVIFIVYYFPKWIPGDLKVFLFCLLSISVIVVIYLLVIHIKINWLQNILAWFGKNSLYIYVYQCICLNIGYKSGYIRVGTIFIIATLISSAFAYITSKNKSIRSILYGDF